jgi:hypothetical protein
VGRLGLADDPSSFLCSSFLAAPRIAVCPVHFALKFGSERPDGTWQLDRPMQIRFDLADSSKDRLVGRIVRTLRPPNSSTVDGGFLPAAVLAQCWPVLLELTEPAATPSLPLGNTVPAPGAPVVVIGFPRNDARIPSALFAQHFAGAAGEKHYMTGVILRSAGETWTLDYDCFTADGVSGGPVIDPNGGAVIGMHVASQPPRDPRARKRGVALVMTRFALQGSGT